ncbi:hypothetical protein F5884DRAFT_859738 [Xylogone sp. PMI_703]|nr:hypothetical protein F5884DRAFT_859738 [Xylogone sp. PMI_703]
MTYTGEITTILVHISIAKHDEPKFVEALRECIAHVTKEPECVRFETFTVPEDGSYFLLETWKQSREWLVNTQLKREYYAPYIAVTEPMWIKPRIIHFIEGVPTLPPVFKPEWNE